MANLNNGETFQVETKEDVRAKFFLAGSAVTAVTAQFLLSLKNGSLGVFGEGLYPATQSTLNSVASAGLTDPTFQKAGALGIGAGLVAVALHEAYHQVRRPDGAFKKVRALLGHSK